MHWIDPDSLPEIEGTVDRFVVNPHGDIDGITLCRGRELVLVHVPPHLHDEIEAMVSPGMQLTVRGVRPRGADMFAAVALSVGAGLSIVDEGPEHGPKHAPRHKAKPRRQQCEKMEAAGSVRLSLFGPKGELRGALLDDGTVVRIGPKEAEGIAELLRPGAILAVHGEGLATKYGRVIEAKKAGPDPSRLAPIKHKPKHGPDHERSAA
jgi:hypothetical protein